MISYREFEEMMNQAKQQGDPDVIKKMIEIYKTGVVDAKPPYPIYQEPQKVVYEQDEFSKRKVVKIDVQIMVENLLGGRDPKRDVQVFIEKYGKNTNGLMNDKLAFVVVNICNIETGDIITLREKYGMFPSSEFLTKLELLRVGEKIT